MDNEISYDLLTLKLDEITDKLKNPVSMYNRLDCMEVHNWIQNTLNSLDETKANSFYYNKDINSWLKATITSLEKLISKRYGIVLDFSSSTLDEAYELILKIANIFTFNGRVLLKEIFRIIINENYDKGLVLKDFENVNKISLSIINHYNELSNHIIDEVSKIKTFEILRSPSIYDITPVFMDTLFLDQIENGVLVNPVMIEQIVNNVINEYKNKNGE